jgi:hypothetical protein
MGESYSVAIVDLFHPEDAIVYDGFPSFELAKEFARRRTRASLEGLRRDNPTVRSKEGLVSAWRSLGENAIVTGGGPAQAYAGKDELDYFIDNPAPGEDCDWSGFAAAVGAKLRPE